jgi:CubicO group peptidase (beta-lactamase class C family)
MREALVPGLQVARIRDGRVESVRAYGMADAEKGRAVTRETVFEAASLGKPVFAYGVVKLASAERIDLDAPILRYLPDLKGAAARLTARQLLSHQGGLPNGGSPRAPSEADIGRFSYSGQGYALLQRAVEAITGKTLDAYMEEAVFAPLGMRHSSYVWRADFARLKAFGHGFAGRSAGRSHIPDARAQSSLETNAGDYARFMLAVLRGEGLSPALARQVFQVQIGLESCGNCLGRPRGPAVEGLGWGLGWGLATGNGRTIAWHWGDNETMQGYAAIALDGSRGLVAFTNSANGHAILPEIARRALGAEAPGYAWVGAYTPWSHPRRQLLAAIVNGGKAGGVTATREDRIDVAQRLLRGRRPAEAASLIRSLPGGARGAGELALLAEAERKAGRLDAARAAAEAALRAEAEAEGARETLRRISLAARRVPAERLALYAGRYRTPYGLLEVVRAGTGLEARFEDQVPSAMLAEGEDAFLIEEIGLPIRFVTGADGRVSHAVVKAGSEVRLERLP